MLFSQTQFCTGFHQQAKCNRECVFLFIEICDYLSISFYDCPCIVCDVCGLGSPSFQSSSVLYIQPTDTASMKNLILQGLQQKLQKSCSRCNKNTLHVESSYILQPPNYLLLFANQFKYINNNVTKDRCPIPMDTTVWLGPLKFNLRTTIDHHGPSIHSGHHVAFINCCNKTLYCHDNTITEFVIIDSKNYSTAYVILQELIDIVLDSNRGVGVWSLPWRWKYPLHPIDNRSRNRRGNLWVGWCFSSWWPLFPSRGSVLIYICILYMSFVKDVYIHTTGVCFRTYIYIQQECHSVLVKLHPITYYRTVFLGSAPFLEWMPLFVFFALPIVSCSLINGLILGCLWLLVFIF